MHRRFIYPNIEQGAPVGYPVLVEAKCPRDLPESLKRMGAKKLEYLIGGVAQVGPRNTVLDLFGGTGLSAACLSRRTKHITSVDLHYSYDTGVPWRYIVQRNYNLLAWTYKTKVRPDFVAADARSLPFGSNTFDIVIAPDSPRSALAWTEEQRELFLAASHEAKRVLRPGGVYAATAPESWARHLAFSNVLVVNDSHLGEGLRFKSGCDPIRYIRATK